MNHRKFPRVACRVAAIACLIAFFLPGFTDTRTSNLRTTKIQLGLPSSPWLHWESESRTEHVPENAPGASTFTSSMSSKWGVELVTWSTPLLVAGIAFFAAARFLGKSPASGG
jgi:hypothetical protein